MKILLALLRKEIILMKHNSLILRVIIGLPVMIMLIMPLIATMDVRDVGVVVIDNDHSQISRRIIADINAAQDLHIISVCGNQDEAMTEIENGRGDVVLTIPYGFSRDLKGIDVEANGVNATKGMLGSQYVISSLMGSIRSWIEGQGHESLVDEPSVINRYNPSLEYRNYMIPALMVVLIIIICGFLPALNLVSEKESGTIEAINVSPVRRFTFVLSKLIPFWIIGMGVVGIGILIGYFIYGLAPAGNIAPIFIAAILFSLVMSGLGVTIANCSSTMIQSIFVMFAFIMIFQLMSGLFTPINSMPEAIQYITFLIPPRYFIEIMRSIYLKSTPMLELWPQFMALIIMAILTCLLAAITYKKTS